MIKYLFYQKNPASHYVYIDLLIENVKSDCLKLQLPAWRPGRYELGNFAKNVKRVDVFNEKNEAITYKKLSKDLWQIDSGNCSSLKVTYSYFSAELNAGACYADTLQLYMNPVHCCLQVAGREMEEHIVELNIPDNYKIASSLKTSGKILSAADFDELVDSPFMASAQLQSEVYEVNKIKFYLHFVGECRPDYAKYKKDFEAFTKKQIEFWGDFPVNEYHFLFQVLGHKFYHGVEHQKNTVIAIGPGYAINSGKTYEDVLGVSCHELFHTWNVKFIRPQEMLPYDYTKENYARTGYVYEGFTTYYGDKLLLSSDVFNEQQYFETLQERLVKHFHGFGRYNLSVADSSWETWLDGYSPGAPYRKTNIYDEGNLIALMLDVKIMQATGNIKRLRDVCVLLYERFGKQKKGYAENDIVNLCNEVGGIDLTEFFKTYVYTANDYEIPLKEAFDYLGLEMKKEKNIHDSEHFFGFKTVESAHFAKVGIVAPYSPAWKAGLFSGDEIMAVNGVMIKHNFNHWLEYFSGSEEIKLTVNSGEHLKELVLQKDKKGITFFFQPQLKHSETATESQKRNFELWRVL
jgi:predicted metalloprotease with PDZ domain